MKLKRAFGFSKKSLNSKIKAKLYTDIAGKRLCPRRLDSMTVDECETNRRYSPTCCACIDGRLVQNFALSVCIDGKKIAEVI